MRPSACLRRLHLQGLGLPGDSRSGGCLGTAASTEWLLQNADCLHEAFQCCWSPPLTRQVLLAHHQALEHAVLLWLLFCHLFAGVGKFRRHDTTGNLLTSWWRHGVYYHHVKL